MSVRNKKFLFWAIAALAVMLAFSFQPALAAKTWKLVTPMAGSGGQWQVSCSGNTSSLLVFE